MKSAIKANKLDFNLMTSAEVCNALGSRLRLQRLSKKIKQQELADRAGVAVGTVQNLESKGQSSLETLVRIIIALDLISELSELFNLKVTSIAQFEKMEELLNQNIRKRVR
jgi:transcriptional regulator with XRE-family HTH domain